MHATLQEVFIFFFFFKLLETFDGVVLAYCLVFLLPSNRRNSQLYKSEFSVSPDILHWKVDENP